MSDAASAPLTPEQIEELRALLAKATKAPWHVGEWCAGHQEEGHANVRGPRGEVLPDDTGARDAELICALRNNADALLTLCDSQALALTQQQQEIARLQVAFGQEQIQRRKEVAALTAERDALKAKYENDCPCAGCQALKVSHE